MTEHEAQILAFQKFPDEKPKDWECNFFLDFDFVQKRKRKICKRVIKEVKL